jgi:hypothetical protein
MATEGGKDRLAAGSFGVVQAFDAAPHKPRGPFAGVAALQSRLPLDLTEALAFRQEQHRPRPPDQPGGFVGTTQKVLKLLPLLIGQSDDDW